MFNDIKKAKKRLQGYANQTPIMTSSTLNKITNSNIYLKCENFQKVGAFKFRGAFNTISQLSVDQRKKGIITYSSGNHAQAVSLVGKLLDIKTTVVMPNDAPSVKRKATESYGSIIIEYDRQKTTREKVASHYQSKHGYIMIPPFDHCDIIAGQGTTALEMFEQVKDLNSLLVPCGGGGLLSGSAIVAKYINSKCKVIGVEPELADDATRSFHTKTLCTVNNPKTIADGTRTTSLGKITFPLVTKYVDDMVTVSELEIINAVKFLFYYMKLVVEPSGALGIAALLKKTLSLSNKTGVIISGGNIDSNTIRTIFAD